MDFAAPHRKKQKSTPMPQIHNVIGSENSMKKRRRTNFNESPKGIERTREYSTRCHEMGKHWENDEQDTRRFCHAKHGVKRKSRWLVLKDLQKPNECKDDSDGCIDTWVEMMSHL